MKPHLRTLPVKLDPHEVAQRADELARELHDQAVAGGAPERGRGGGGPHRAGAAEAQGEDAAAGGGSVSAPYVKVNFRDVTTGACWSWRMRSDVAAARAAEQVAAWWARDGVRVEVVHV